MLSLLTSMFMGSYIAIVVCSGSMPLVIKIEFLECNFVNHQGILLPNLGSNGYMAVSQNLVPQANIKIAGKCMSITKAVAQ